ncbi:hypothetical protein E5347_07825 [Clostridium sartagoforme]|uniref:Uncharacterized protein n=1 Tax=Clostridium sartagoforme TaxID=84031 RepID=A0A4S2DKD9_9CLOT|nr:MULTISPECIES: hypothetical protein [Clostridium]MBS5938293.1 hypothetical protein [Clostridium sp.]TGY42707.1 hypothetical protein E5347_07825 [Clostridium sartagoforme]
MSKKRRRHRREREDIAGVQGELNNNLPFGINPNQLLSLLGENFDLNNLGNMMSSMKDNGVNLNNFNPNSAAQNQQVNNSSNLNNVNNANNMNNINSGNGYDFGGLQGIINALGMNGFNQSNSNLNNTFNEENIGINDEVMNEIDKEEERDLKDGGDEEYLEEGELNNNIMEEDENIQMLISIKSIVDDRKADFIERVIEAYKKGLI